MPQPVTVSAAATTHPTIRNDICPTPSDDPATLQGAASYTGATRNSASSCSASRRCPSGLDDPRASRQGFGMSDQAIDLQAGLASRLRAVKDRIASAARAVGRDGADITLVAVSKTHDAAVISAALAAGQRIFGENRVQEAQAKYPALKAAHPDL